MRILFFAFAFLISFCSLGQKLGWQNASEVVAPANFDNIHTQKIFGDSLSTSFVIFVKKEVKMHKHLEHSEHVYVLEGTADMLLGGIKLSLKPGEFIFIPKNTPHAVYVSSNTVLKVISIQSPHFDGTDRVMLEE